MGFFVTFFAFLICIFVSLGCQSTSVQNVSGTEQDVVEASSRLENSVSIKLEKNPQEYFGSINKDIMDDMKIASPASINRALNKMRKAAIEYTESEKVLYNIASRIMSQVWPKQQSLVNVPALNSISNTGANYIAILDSAKSGYFEERNGEKDFFLTVLPTLAVLSSNPNQEYYDKAEKALLEGIKIKPDSVLCNYLLGVLYKKQKNYDKALAAFDKATESNAIVYEVLAEKADTLIKLGRYDSAINILDKLVIQFPSDVQVLKLYATASYEMGDFSRAETYASLVLQQNPSDLEFVLFRAKIFVETGEYLKASSLLDVYAKSYPTQHEYLLLRSKLQKEWNKNISAAMSTIERALTLYPDDYDIILYATQFASETGLRINGKTGGELAELILKDNPNDVRGLQYSVQAYYNEGRYAQAYEISKKIINNPAVSQAVILMHVKVCLALQYNDEAWRYASNLYERNPNDMDTIQYYIEVMITTGRTQNASRLVNSMLSSNPSATMKSFLYYERSFLTTNETTMLSDLRSSLIANPRNSDALFRMYEIYYRRQDYRKAQYYLKQVVSLNPTNEKYLRLNSELDQLVK